MTETIRDNIIFSGNHRINLLLKVIDKIPNLGFTELGRELKQIKPKPLSGGTFWHTLKDARVMQLVENGYGFHLSESGKRFLYNFSQEVNKEVHLKVPLYRRCFEELPNQTDYDVVRNWFLPHIQEIDKKLRGTIIRRYLEGVYGISVKKRPRVNIKSYKTLRDYSPTKSTTTAMASGGGGGGMGGYSVTYYDFFKNRNFSDDKIIHILSILSKISEDSREASLKLLLKEMKI